MKDIKGIWENGGMDEFMDQMEEEAVQRRRNPKPRTARIDGKRNKTSYISSNKKGKASQAALAAKWDAEAAKNQGRKDRSMSDLEREITGHGKRH